MPYAGDEQWVAPGRPHRRQAEHRRHARVPCAPGERLQLQAGRQRRLVRRRRSRQVRRQRRHLGLDAAQLVGARRSRSAARRRLRRREDEHPREQEQGSRPARRGALGAGVRAQDAGAGRARSWRAWRTTRSTTRSGRQLSHGAARGPMPRFLQPASTAATLNLAANAAQARASGAKIDQAFADKCLKAAERAWAAAKANPAVYRGERAATAAGPTTTTTSATSSTGRRRSSTSRPRRPSTRTFVDEVGVLQEGRRRLDGDDRHAHVDDLGRHAARSGSISLAIVPNGLGKEVADAIREERRRVADRYMDLVDQGGLPGAVQRPARRATRGGRTRSC